MLGKIKSLNLQLKGQLLAVVLFVSGYLLFTFAYRPLSQMGNTSSSLEIVAEISGGSMIAVFANADFNQVYTQPIEGNKKYRYVFANLPAEITYLRIDPTDEVNQRVLISEIVYINGETRELVSGSYPLANWESSGLLPPAEDSDGYLVSSNNDPIVWQGGMQFAPGDSQASFGVITVAKQLLIGLLVVVIVYIFCGSPLLAVVLPLLLGVALLRYGGAGLQGILAASDLPIQRGNLAIGSALFFGYSKLQDQLLCGLLLAISVATGVSSAVISKLIRLDRRPAEHRELTWSNNKIFQVFVILAFLAITFPETSPGYLAKVVHAFSDFDSTSVICWQYLAHLNFLPYRDYWFPYSGRYNQLGPFPSDQLRTFFQCGVLFSFLFVGLYRFFRGSIIQTLLPLVMVGYGIHSGYFTGDSRYLNPVAIMLWYFVALRDRGSLITFAFCGLFGAFIFYYEPPQLIYAAPGVFVLTLWFFNEYRKQKLSTEFLKSTAVCLAVFAMSVAAILGVMLKAGQIEGLVDFYSNLSAPTVSSAIAAPVGSWLGFEFNDLNIILWATLLLLALSSYCLLLSGRRSEAILPFCLSLVLAMIMFKMLVRPHMARQMMGVATIGFATLLLPLIAQLSLRRKLALVFLLGFSVAVLNRGGVVNSGLQMSRRNVLLFPEKVGNWFEQWRQEDSLTQAYFDPKSFKPSGEDQKQLIDFLKNDLLPQDSIYVLGNASSLYIILQRKSLPYTFSLYDGSGAWLQGRTINWLQQNSPKYIIWDSSDRWFDVVPNTTRTPLLHQYIALNYSPEISIGKYKLFKPLARGEIPDIARWKEVFGERIDIGAVPYATSLAELGPCQQEKENCLTFLSVDDETFVEKNKLRTVTFTVGDHLFYVDFMELSDSYGDPSILLDRLWFWTLGQKQGIPTSFEISAQHKLEYRTESGNILY